MNTWNLLTLLFSLAAEWEPYYDPIESGPALRSLMLYLLQGMRSFHNCEIAPYAFAFDSSVCELFRPWLQ